jgi:Conserved TM helix
MQWGQKILFAVAIVIVTWALAKAAKWAFAKMVDQITFLQRGTASGESVGMALGRIVSLLVWLFGLILVLQQLGFDSAITPVQGLLGNFIGYLDNIVFAAAIFFIGSMIARIVRDLVVTALSTVDFDRWANKGGIEAVTGNNAITKTIGTLCAGDHSGRHRGAPDAGNIGDYRARNEPAQHGVPCYPADHRCLPAAWAWLCDLALDCRADPRPAAKPWR